MTAQTFRAVPLTAAGVVLLTGCSGLPGLSEPMTAEEVLEQAMEDIDPELLTDVEGEPATYQPEDGDPQEYIEHFAAAPAEGADPYEVGEQLEELAEAYGVVPDLRVGQGMLLETPDAIAIGAESWEGILRTASEADYEGITLQPMDRALALEASTDSLAEAEEIQQSWQSFEVAGEWDVWTDVSSPSEAEESFSIYAPTQTAQGCFELVPAAEENGFDGVGSLWCEARSAPAPPDPDSDSIQPGAEISHYDLELGLHVEAFEDLQAEEIEVSQEMREDAEQLADQAAGAFEEEVRVEVHLDHRGREILASR